MGHFKLTFCRAYNMKSCTILIIASLAILRLEACIAPPPPPPATTAATTAGPTTTAKATTTTKAPDCPMENKMCLAADASNYIEPKTVASSGLCSAECDKVADCKYWSFIATQTKCLLLKSCDKAADEDGVSAGPRVASPPPSSSSLWTSTTRPPLTGQLSGRRTPYVRTLNLQLMLPKLRQLSTLPNAGS